MHFAILILALAAVLVAANPDGDNEMIKKMGRRPLPDPADGVAAPGAPQS